MWSNGWKDGNRGRPVTRSRAICGANRRQAQVRPSACWAAVGGTTAWRYLGAQVLQIGLRDGAQHPALAPVDRGSDQRPADRSGGPAGIVFAFQRRGIDEFLADAPHELLVGVEPLGIRTLPAAGLCRDQDLVGLLEEKPRRSADLPFGGEQVVASCQVDRADDDHSTVAPFEPVEQCVIEPGHITQEAVHLVQPQHRRIGTPAERRVPQERGEGLRARGGYDELGNAGNTRRTASKVVRDLPALDAPSPTPPLAGGATPRAGGPHRG